MPDSDQPRESLLHMLSHWMSSATWEARGWAEPAGDERRLYPPSGVASGALTAAGGQGFGANPAAAGAGAGEEVNRLRSTSSAADQRAWSLDPGQRRSYMLESIRRSPAASAADLQHQELLAQLRENNLPEFVERLLSDKNQQIDELEQNVRSLSQQSPRPASAGDRSSGLMMTAVSDPSDDHQPTPELLRRAASSLHSDPAGDLSRPDLSMVYQKEEGSPPSLRGLQAGSPAVSPRRPGSADAAGSEHSWDSAPTVAGGGSQPGDSVGGSELASAAGSSASGDSIHNLRAALARKKQLLNSRKRQLERSAKGEKPEEQQQQQQQHQQHDAGLQQPVETPSQPPAAEVGRLQQQLDQLRSRLDVLDPILSRLEADYSRLADGSEQRRRRGKAAAAAARPETELRLVSEVAELRRTMEGQDGGRRRLEGDLRLMVQQGVPESDPHRRQLEEQLLVTLRDMEINKLNACSKMHEASALMASAERQAHREEEEERPGPDSEPASSGYMSEMPEPTADTAGTLKTHSHQHIPQQHIPQHSLQQHNPQHSPQRGSQQHGRRPAEYHRPVSLAGRQEEEEEDMEDTDGESAFESGVAEFESGVADFESTCDAGMDWRSSCPSLIDELAGLADMNAEVDRLRARVAQLEIELGQRGDAPSSCRPDPGLHDRLEQERAAWSQERQRLQQRIARLDCDQEQRLRRTAAGEGDDARLQYAYGRFLRAESYRRALCWQKRYLMVLLGGYQRTEVMTLQRMTEMTGGTFRPDGRRYLSPAAKFRAAVWVAVAVSRMDFMVNRWRSGRRLAGALSAGPAAPEPPPPPAVVRPLSSSSLVSASCDEPGELDRLGRVVRDGTGSAPDVQFDSRSLVSVSDVCTEDLEPYLTRFDALLDRQGLPPQPGGRPDNCR